MPLCLCARILHLCWLFVSEYLSLATLSHTSLRSIKGITHFLWCVCEVLGGVWVCVWSLLSSRRGVDWWLVLIGWTHIKKVLYLFISYSWVQREWAIHMRGLGWLMGNKMCHWLVGVVGWRVAGVVGRRGLADFFGGRSHKCYCLLLSPFVVNNIKHKRKKKMMMSNSNLSGSLGTRPISLRRNNNSGVLMAPSFCPFIRQTSLSPKFRWA